MKINILTILVIFGIINFTNAQHRHSFCAAEVPNQEWEIAFQKLITTLKNDKKRNGFSTHTIPVIFHVIHGGEPIGIFPNIQQGQIGSQITILNQDFNANAYNINNYPTNAFVNWVTNQALPTANIDSKGRVKIANMGIEFCLADVDVNGNVLIEPGIDRINYNTKGWQNPNIFSTQATFKNYLDNTIKPESIWDVTKYMNFWISDKNIGLQNGGVSSIPPLSGLSGLNNSATTTTDGIWCYTKAIGNVNLFPAGIYFTANIDGRTLTHETGHYFGLRHIWGDSNCGNDSCNDTPPATTDNSGFPIYPLHVGSCSSPSNNPDGEMFMNLMDYTAGPSKYMFTIDQMERVHTALINSPFRNQLGTHGKCSSLLSTNEEIQVKDFTIYPNPTTDNIIVKTPNQSIKSIKIFDISGSFIQEFFEHEFSIANYPTGFYLINIHTEKGVVIKKLIKH